MDIFIPPFQFDNSYAQQLEDFYVPWQGDQVPDPQLLRFNRPLAEELGINPEVFLADEGAAILAGKTAPLGAEPLAMAYAGHQFGNFVPQLGDGRALLLGEVIDRNGVRRDIHLKGSGRTPFSRGGDGKAVLGPVLREYLFGEAMHAMGIPTTRALAAVTTGEMIERDGQKPGAVLARVALSHLRVGTFQFFYARGDTDKVRQLADYAIARHYPELINNEERYLELFCRVRDAQASLIAKWVLAGFVHGVMNTDNMTISGETIDYGPCAFIDAYSPNTVFSSIDAYGRYAYGQQPKIAQWNLARFAESLLDLIVPDDREKAARLAMTELQQFDDLYHAQWLKGMRSKLGLLQAEPDDYSLANDLFTAMKGQNVDFTLFFRNLANDVRSDTSTTTAMFNDAGSFSTWLDRYIHRCEMEDRTAEARADTMNQINPVYILRNHKVEEALAASLQGNMAPFDVLLSLVNKPFERRNGFDEFELPAPEGSEPHITFCGT